MPEANLCFLIKGNKVLLAMKKRGFGVGKWNGSGGKVKDGETQLQALIREVREELGVIVVDKDLENFGILHFWFDTKPDWNQNVAIFVTRSWKGRPTESEEMKPKWFDRNKLPWDKMWPDDPKWLPLVLAGKKITAEFYFSDEVTIRDFKIAPA